MTYIVFIAFYISDVELMIYERLGHGYTIVI